MPAKDVVIEGKFIINSYSVIYKVDEEIIATDSFTYGSKITLRGEPVKEGYTFSGWSEVPATMPAKDVIIKGTFVLDDTAVDDITDESEKCEIIYDLKGNLILNVENLERGIYIINGKKVLVK